MTQYLISYVGTPREMGRDEGRQHMVKYRDWLDNLGDAVVSAANPVRNTKTIDSEGKVSEGSVSHMSGYTIIQAESDEAALALAQACPYLEVGGQLEVSELVQLSS